MLCLPCHVREDKHGVDRFENIELVQVAVEASLDLDADASEAFHMELAEPALPMQAYLRTLPASTIVPDHDLEITCDIDNVPHGVFFG